MDTLTALLDGPRARGAFLLRSVLDPPFALRVADEAPLTLLTVLRGACWLVRDDAGEVLLRPGDVAVVRGPQPYTVADEPGTPWRTLIGPGQVCTPVGGDGRAPATQLGVRTWGDRLDAATVLLTGTYQLGSEVGGRLLGALPSTLVQPSGTVDGTLIRLLTAEIAGTGPGQELVLDRLLDLLLVSVLRAWLADPAAGAPGWYRAQSDPVVGRALRLLHAAPRTPWTVASLAAGAGVSRSALARRFTALVGEPPMAYLTGWRLALAADLLREPDATLGAVARQVGYGTAFALSAAFKRERGLSPREFRRGGRDPRHPVAASPETVTLRPATPAENLAEGLGTHGG